MKLYISHNIKYLLDKENWDHATFAAQFDVSRAMISHYTLEKATPKVETLVKIASYFKISLDDLITGDLQKQKYINVIGVEEPTPIYENSLKDQLNTANLLIAQKEKNIQNLEKVVDLLEEKIELISSKPKAAI